MSIPRRPARSLQPAVDTLEHRIALSRMDLGAAPTHPADAPDASHQGDRSVRKMDIPDSRVAPTRPDQHAAPTHKPDAQSQGGGAVGGGAPIVGPAAVHGSTNHASGYAAANGSSSSPTSSISWTSTVAYTGTTSSSIRGGVTSNAGFNSSGGTVGTSSLTGLTSSSGGSSGGMAVTVAGGQNGFLAAGQPVPSMPSAPLPVSTPSDTPLVHPDGGGLPGEPADIAAYNALGGQLPGLRQAVTDAIDKRSTDVADRNEKMAKFFEAGGKVLTLEDFKLKGSEKGVEEWEIKAEFKARNTPEAVAAAQAAMPAMLQVMKDDVAVAKAGAAVAAQATRVSARYTFLRAKYIGRIRNITPPWRF